MLVEQLLNAQEKLKQIQDKEASWRHLSPKESIDAMLSKTKQYTPEMASVEAESEELEREIKLYEEKLCATEKVLNDLKGGRAEKFLEMQQKEKKMQSFLDNYEATLLEHTIAKKSVEQNIAYLQERLTQVGCCVSNTTSSEAIEKENHDNVVKLNEELEVQRGELKQLEETEEKTMKEIEMSKQKIANLRIEIEKLTNLDEVCIGSDAKCLGLEAQKKAEEEKRSKMQAQLKEQKNLIESLQEQLNDSPLHKNIEALNEKFLVLRQSVTKTQEELEMKERELNYKPVIENIRTTVSQLNEEIKRKLNT